MALTEKLPAEILEEMEKLRHQLHQSEARFRDVIEKNADAIVVIDQEGVIRFANQEAVNLFAASRTDLIGNSFGFPLVAGETTELDLVRESGPLTVEMRVVESQWQGQPSSIATLRNITERKREEQQARELIRAQTARASAEESVAKFRFLAESSALLASSLDQSRTLSALARLCVAQLADWVVIYVYENDQLRRIDAAHRDAAKADLTRSILRSKMPAQQVEAVAKMVRTRTPQMLAGLSDAQLAEMIPDATQLQIVRELGMNALMLVPMVARDRVMGAMSLIRAQSGDDFSSDDLDLAVDLASRAALAIDNARLYEEARQANQSKTELLAIISHDLRTPLNSILGYGQLMGMGIPSPLPAGAAQQLERIMTSARHQLYLIDQLLHFARIDAGHENIELTDIDVRSVLKDAAMLIEPVAREKDLRVETVLPAQPLVAHSDADKLRQILLNLLGNAVRYTETGSIILEARASGFEVVICVRDTGVGIAEEHLPHVFEPFWQVDHSQRSRGGGTGLGLAVVKQVVQLLGGRVSVSSKLGDGSTFEVRLPTEAR